MGEDFYAMTIKFTDAAKFYKELPHQKDAWEFLQSSQYIKKFLMSSQGFIVMKLKQQMLLLFKGGTGYY
jgi:hypothetical protein